MSINSLNCSSVFFQTFASEIGARNSFFMQLGNITTASGGSNAGTDFCNSIATDANGFVYCGGQTNGSLGETSGGGFDAFILKADQQGNIIWLKQLGANTFGGGEASGQDYCFSIVVNSSGDIYFAGKTSGNLGDTNAGSFDAFVMKLNSSGALTWVTQLGNSTTLSGSNNKSGNDTCYSIALDSSENIICAGSTTSSLVETSGGGCRYLCYEARS